MFSAPKPGKTITTGVDTRRVQQAEGYMLQLQHKILYELKTSKFGSPANPHILVRSNYTNRRPQGRRAYERNRGLLWDIATWYGETRQRQSPRSWAWGHIITASVQSYKRVQRIAESAYFPSSTCSTTFSSVSQTTNRRGGASEKFFHSESAHDRM